MLGQFSYQSYHTGIETGYPFRLLLFFHPINRTTLELKQAKEEAMVIQVAAINRTTLELKLDITKLVNNPIPTINRTTLELKLN